MNDACAPLDFARVDRVPDSQLDTIRAMHEAFARTLSENLSLYLRSEVSADDITIGQLPFGDFAAALPSPGCLAWLDLQPFSGCALVNVEPSLLAPILEHLLGGNGKLSTVLDREITEVEQEMLGGFFRIVARELGAAWAAVVPVQFAVASIETSPQLSRRIAPIEEVVLAAIQMRIGQHAGKVNFALPSIALKTMRQHFDRQGAPARTPSRDAEQAIRQKLAHHLLLDVECSVTGARVRMRELLNLQEGQILSTGIPIDSPVSALVNGQAHFQGEMEVIGSKTAMRVIDVCHESRPSVSAK